MILSSYLPGCSTEPWSTHDAAPLRSSFCCHHPAGRCGIFAQPFPRLMPPRAGSDPDWAWLAAGGEAGARLSMQTDA